MDADIPRIPDKPVTISKTGKSFDEKFKELYKPRKSVAGLVVSYGPIIGMPLVGAGWKDLGVGVIGGRPVGRSYRYENPRCTLTIYFRPTNHKQDDSAFLQKLTQSIGPVPKSKWEEINLFGGSAGLFSVESVEVVELGGKNVIIMTGQHTKGDRTRAKHVYVSLSGDWKDSYDIAFGGLADSNIFDKQVTMFDKALKKVIWKKE